MRILTIFFLLSLAAMNSSYVPAVSFMTSPLTKIHVEVKFRFFVATTYYVSPTGSDAASGTSTATPWLTVTKVNASTFSPDDLILFQCGGTWRDAALTMPSSGTSGHPITFGQYDVGAFPIISGSNILTGGWTIQQTNIWKKSLTTLPKVVYFNGVRGRQRTSIATIVQPYDFWWSSNVLYVWSPTNVDPTTIYFNPGIEGSIRSRPVVSNSKNYITLLGLNIRDGNNGGGGQGNVQTGTTDWTISFCVIERGGGAGVETNSGSGLNINNTQIINNADYGIVAASQSPSYVTACIIGNNGWRTDITASQTSGIQGDLGGLTVLNTEVYGSAIGTTSQASKCHGIYNSTPNTGVMYVLGCNIHDNPQGAGVKSYANAVIQNCTFARNAYEALEYARSGTFDSRILMTGCTDYGSTTGFPSVNEFGSATGKMSLNLYNNTFYKTGSAGQGVVVLADNIDTFRMKNTIMYMPAGRYAFKAGVALSHTVDINYNLYYRDDAGFECRNGGTTYTVFATWKSGTGFDANSLNVNPLLVNPPADMTITKASPAFATGINVGLPFFYDAPSIGYYQIPFPIYQHNYLKQVTR